MIKRLRNLQPAEVSLVPRGANKKQFLIFKSQGEKQMAAGKEVAEMIKNVDPKVMARVDTVLKAFGKPDEKDTPEQQGTKDQADKDPAADPSAQPMESEAEKAAPLSDRAQAALKAVARILVPFKDEITDDHLDAVQSEVGISGEETGDEATGEDKMEDDMSEAPEGVSDEHHAAGMKMAKAAYMQHMGKMGYRKSPDAEPQLKSDETDMDSEDNEEEDVSKIEKSALDLTAFPEKQRAQLEGVFKAYEALETKNQELVKKSEDLEKSLKDERDIRIGREFDEKAKSFTHLGAESSELAKVMKSMSEKDPEGYKSLEAILKATNEQSRQAALTGGVFREIGTSRSATVSGGGEFDARIDALVNARVEKSDGSRTREQIYSEVLQSPEGQKLYAQYKSNRKGGI